MFSLGSVKKEAQDKAVVIRARGANIQTEQLKQAFGDDVIVIDSDAEIRNGLEYIGTFHPGENGHGK